MNVDPGELGVVKDILWQGEQVRGTFKQRTIGPGGSVTVPTSVIVDGQPHNNSEQGDPRAQEGLRGDPLLEDNERAGSRRG